MKISKLFHWLYCLVMFLPVLFIPIMAIYSHRHTIDSYSVSRDETHIVNTTYHINNLLPNGLPSSVDGWSDDFNNLIFYNNCIQFEVASEDEDSVYYTCSYNFIADHYYYCSFDFSSDYSSYLSLFQFSLISDLDDNYDFFIDHADINVGSSYVRNSYLAKCNFSNDCYCNFYVFNNESDNITVQIKYFQLFDLTNIFGSGNEPSLIECDTIFTEPYYFYGTTYDYVVSSSTTNTVTYNDTDIGSQFVYDTYNVVDKYFNYDNVLNIGDLYEWCEINLFNGNATLGFFIFFHLLEYWLLTSLLWLIFDVLMYVPQLCHRWLDKASLE